LRDRYNNNGGARQVTLIQAEHLEAIASFLGKEKIEPGLTRRNIVVEGINLLSLKGKDFTSETRFLNIAENAIPAHEWNKFWGRVAIMPCGATVELPPK
jgi:MOSC domain-containing protein YiiM